MSNLIPVVQNGTYKGAARGAGFALVSDFTGPSHAVVTDPTFGADPTGQKDSTAAIQKAVDAVWAQGKGRGSVEIPGGIYKVSAPFIQMRPEVTIFGHGDGTVIIATGQAPTEKIGVFHNGTYNTASVGAGQFRFGLKDMWIKSQLPGEQHYDAIPNVCGVIMHTDLDGHESDPDSVSQMRGLTIWDMHHGLVLFGKDDQGGKFDAIRIRGGLEAPFILGKPIGHPLRATASVSPGSADNKFTHLDVSSGNKAGGKAAGVEIWTSNCHFSDSTSWYSKRNNTYTAPVTDRDALRDGAGWYIYGTKNSFTGCTAQENGGMGFAVVYPGNMFSNCNAESSSFFDAVKGSAKVNEAHGFYLANGATDTQLIGCRSGNARGAEKGQGFGYYVENYSKTMTIMGTAAVNATGDIYLGTNLGNDVRVLVNNTTLNWGTGGATATGAAAATGGGVELTLPAQLPGLTQEWDFSQEIAGATLTKNTSLTGTGDLVQSDTTHAPTGAALGSRRGAKFVRSEGDTMALAALPSGMTAAAGYTIVWAGQINVNEKAASYLFGSKDSASAKNSVSVSLTDQMEVRATSSASGPSSAGLAVTTTGAALPTFTPTTIVVRVNGAVLDVFAGTVQGTFTGDATHVGADLMGKAVLNGYNDGTNPASVTVGELAIFNRALTDAEVVSVRAALTKKWG